MLALLTETQVGEGRMTTPAYAANRDRATVAILREARDPQVKNHGDWHVWEVEQADTPIPDEVAPWVATVVDHGERKLSVDWTDTGTQCATAQRARFVYHNRPQA